MSTIDRKAKEKEALKALILKGAKKLFVEKAIKRRVKILLINTLTRLFVFVLCYFVALFSDAKVSKNITKQFIIRNLTCNQSKLV